MAFERIVKEQVEQLSTAPSNVVDQVTTEVIGAVRDCSKVSHHFCFNESLIMSHYFYESFLSFV